MIFFSRKGSDRVPRTVTIKPEEAEFPITYQLSAMQGIGKRSEQQDSFASLNDNDVVKSKREGLFAVVADGMGGLASGKQVSELVIDCMLHAFAQIDLQGDLFEQLKAAAVSANERTFQQFNSRGGSTLIACLLYGEKLWYVSVGDSALFLLRNGTLSRINEEHNSLTDDYHHLVSGGDMDPYGARSNPERAALSRYMGMYDLDEVDGFRRPLPLESGDTILICSDGISSFLSEGQLKQCLQGGSPRDICSQLEEAIYWRSARNQDNYTAIVIQCRS